MILEVKYQVIFDDHGEHTVHDTFDSRSEAEQKIQELKNKIPYYHQPIFEIWITETKEQQT